MDRYEKINKRKNLKKIYKKFYDMNKNIMEEIWETNRIRKSTKNKEEIEKYTSKWKKLCKSETLTRNKMYEISVALDAKMISELPLLLFAINESRVSLSGNYEPTWEYIYYYPDYDEVVKKTKLETVSLEKNDVNLTDLFYGFGMPDEIKSSFIHYASTDHKYDGIISKAVETTKTIIDQIFEENEINSWDEVGTHLKDYVKKYNEESAKKGKKHLTLI